jgi:hypothetical protein
MRSVLLAVAAAVAVCPLLAQSAVIDVATVHEDARVLRRIIDVSKKDLPREVITSIAREDLDILRGRRTDSSYLWAAFEREEDSRIEEGFTIAAGKKPTVLRHRGENVYKLTITSPARRYLVRKNQRVLVERVDMDLSPAGEGRPRMESIEVNEWLEPGAKREYELPMIARVARVTVIARTEEAAGPAGLELAFSVAKLVDDARSPYARAVENLKLVLQRVEKGDRDNLRTLANLLVADPALMALSGPAPAVRTAVDEGLRPFGVPTPPTLSGTDLYIELQTIQDLLTGTPEERGMGMDALHQLIRQVRSQR